MVQDGPPPGGFPAIRYARRVPSSGPTGLTLFTGERAGRPGWLAAARASSSSKGPAAGAAGHTAAAILPPHLSGSSDGWVGRACVWLTLLASTGCRPSHSRCRRLRCAVGAAVMAYGFYKVGQGNRERRGIKAEHFAMRASLVPFLQVGRMGKAGGDGTGCSAGVGELGADLARAFKWGGLRPLRCHLLRR